MTTNRYDWSAGRQKPLMRLSLVCQGAVCLVTNREAKKDRRATRCEDLAIRCGADQHKTRFRSLSHQSERADRHRHSDAHKRFQVPLGKAWMIVDNSTNTELSQCVAPILVQPPHGFEARVKTHELTTQVRLGSWSLRRRSASMRSWNVIGGLMDEFSADSSGRDSSVPGAAGLG